MASSIELVEYIAEQLGGINEDVTYRKMFGEYGLYCGGKFFAVVCDNALFVKPTKAGRAFLENGGEPVEAPPYRGAGLYFLIADIDNAEDLRQLRTLTCSELPLPKPKKPKVPKPK